MGSLRRALDAPMTTPNWGQPHPHIKHERMFVEADPERKTHVTRGEVTHLG